VIGSDLSPCQPSWVPPNVQFEVDDATQPWTWKDNDFDFIHIRYLFGAIADWNAIFKQAYRCCAPGGWVQSCEADVHFFCDDDTAHDPQVAPYLKTWAKLYEAGGAATKRPFFVQQENLQEKGIEAAGFTDMKVVDYKVGHARHMAPMSSPRSVANDINSSLSAGGPRTPSSLRWVAS
jgi:ubiquinone/menaquinone biosynthesis C-methylase UbiE